MKSQSKLLSYYPVDYLTLDEHFTEEEPHAAWTAFRDLNPKINCKGELI